MQWFGGEEKKQRRVTCVLFLDLLFMVSRRLLGTSHVFCVWSVSDDYDLKARKEKGLVREAQDTAHFAHVRPGPQAGCLAEGARRRISFQKAQNKGPTELGHLSGESLPSVSWPDGSAGSPGLHPPVWTGRNSIPSESSVFETQKNGALAGSCVLLRNLVDQVRARKGCEAQPFTPNMTSGNASGLSG